MSDQHIESVRQTLIETRNSFSMALYSEEFLRSVSAAANAVVTALRAGNKILLAGNGGSAADAQHIAAELMSKFNFDRAPLPAIALTTDSSVITAIGNDIGYEEVFARQIKGLAKPNDVFIAISTSGKSANILQALRAANQCDLVTIGLGAENSNMAELCDHMIAVPDSRTPYIQQVHITVGHILCGIVEQDLFNRTA